jgi:hypothetical protein
MPLPDGTGSDDLGASNGRSVASDLGPPAPRS